MNLSLPCRQRVAGELCEIVTTSGSFSYILKRSGKRRTLSVSVLDTAEIQVAAPAQVSDLKVRAFINEKAPWIASKLRQVLDKRRSLKAKGYRGGDRFLFLGDVYPLEIRESNLRTGRLDFDGKRWLVKIPPACPQQEQPGLVRQKLLSWYCEQAKEVFGGRIFYYARLMGLDLKKIGIRNQKRIWGSCNVRDKSINLNWRLVLSPLEVIDYVVVHELSHLFFPNHSRRFWRKVATVLPDYKERKNWIRKNHFEMLLPEV